MMKNFITIAAFAAGTNARVSRNNSCCFHLTSSGGASGKLGQLSDGQNRIGDNSLSAAQYCIDSEGAITDSKGRGCILTPPTTQLQCDEGVSPTPGFSLSSQGELEYHGSKDFVACATGQNGGLNVYTTPTKSDVTGCVNVKLTADSCSSSGSAPVPSVPIESPLPGSPVTVVSTISATALGGGGGTGSSSIEQPSSSASVPNPSGGGSGSQPSGSASSDFTTPPTTEPSSNACPTILATGSYEYPHLIVPVDSSSPNTAAGTSYNGTVSSTISSAFNFDIPSSDSGKICSLVFLFPELQDLETSSFSFTGDGKIDFAKLSSAVDKSTTFNNLPSVSQDLGSITMSPGNSYIISTFSCPAGETVAYEMKNSGSTDLNFFEDYNPSPLGLYITTC
ncbi:GPI anchored cell wall protein, putative [Penicillium digitatum]|uniref:GPI anchored cell wall protein, putative n=1 Tax=Penicillium digitatum TaxID=36651 RepID=A0A7T7BLK8_PENDI|nr:GPI anchored cell wall protein, putative [Penicillium digitatum]